MRLATTSYAATAAGVRAVIAAYPQAVDDGRHHGNGAWRFHSRTLRFTHDE